MKNLYEFNKFNEKFKDLFRKETKAQMWAKFYAEWNLEVTDFNGKVLDISKTDEIRIKVYYKPLGLLISATQVYEDPGLYVESLKLHYYFYSSVMDRKRVRITYQDGLRWNYDPIGVEKELSNSQEVPFSKTIFSADPSQSWDLQRIEVLKDTLSVWQTTSIPGIRQWLGK